MNFEERLRELAEKVRPGNDFVEGDCGPWSNALDEENIALAAYLDSTTATLLADVLAKMRTYFLAVDVLRSGEPTHSDFCVAGQAEDELDEARAALDAHHAKREGQR